MGRPRTAKHPKPEAIEPEDESQEAPEEEAAVVIEPEPPAATMSKADACRALLAEGITDNEDAIAAARSQFGIEIKATDYSLYKSKAKAAKATAKPEPAKRGRKPKVVVEGYVAPPEKPKAAGEPDLLLALEGIKELVVQFGADRVKRMVDIIG